MNSGRKLKLWGLTLAAVAASLIAVAPASAANTYASPTGTNANACTSGDPCDIYSAVNLANTDTAFLAAGAYTLSTADLFIDGTVQPQVAGPRPRIQSTDGSGVIVSPGATVKDLQIDIAGLGANENALELQNTTSAAYRVEVIAGALNPPIRAVWLGGGALLSDSTSRTASPSSAAVYGATGGGTLRNVTAIATGLGSSGFTGGETGGSIISNSILRGGQYDVLAVAGQNADIDISYSNFVTSLDEAGGSEITAVTGNSTATPLFVSLAGGNFHQCPGSPTINAGNNAFTQSLDFDSEARIIGGVPDMGADEFSGADLCTSPTANQPPAVTPKKKCKKGKKLKKGKCVKKKRKKKK
jgi:hypothetical protein